MSMNTGLVVACLAVILVCLPRSYGQEYYVGCEECFEGDGEAQFCLETDPDSKIQSPNGLGKGVCSVGTTTGSRGRTGFIKGLEKRVRLEDFIKCNRWIRRSKWCPRDCRVPKVSFCSMVDYPVNHNHQSSEELDALAMAEYNEFFKSLQENIIDPMVEKGMKFAYIGEDSQWKSGCESSVRQLICHKVFPHCDGTGVCRSYGEAVVKNCKVMMNSSRVERVLKAAELPWQYESWPSPHDPSNPQECCCRRSWAVVASGDTVKYKVLPNWGEKYEDGDYDFAANLEVKNYNDQSNAMRMVKALTQCHRSEADAMSESTVIQLNQDEITRPHLARVLFGEDHTGRAAVAEILEDGRQPSCPASVGRFIDAFVMKRRRGPSSVTATIPHSDAEFASVHMSVHGRGDHTYKMGPNVYMAPDYSDYKPGPRPNADTFAKVILGDTDLKKNGGRVVESGPEDRVMFIYLDHGSPPDPQNKKYGFITGDLDFLSGEFQNGENSRATHLDDTRLIQILQRMKREMRFKSMALVVEACYSGAMFYRNGEELKEMGIVATTSAQPESPAFNDDTQSFKTETDDPAVVRAVIFKKDAETPPGILMKNTADYDYAMEELEVTARYNDKGWPLPGPGERSKPLSLGIVQATVATTTNFFISFANVIETWIARGQLGEKTWQDLFETAKAGHDILVAHKHSASAEERRVRPQLYGSRNVAQEKLSCFWGAGATGKVPITDEC